VKYSNAECWGEASAEAGTEPSQACQHHQTQGHQRQQKLAPPQIYADMHTDIERYGSVSFSHDGIHLLTLCKTEEPALMGKCIIQHHILVIINGLWRE